MKKVSSDDVYDAPIGAFTVAVPGAPGRFVKITFPNIDHPLVAQALIRAGTEVMEAYRNAVEQDRG